MADIPLQNLDDFDISILKQLEIDGRMAFSAIASELGISNTMVHQRVNKMTEQGILTGIKPVLNEKKIGYDWGAFTGITLEKDHDSDRIIAKNHEHMRQILYNQIDNIEGIAKTDSMIELGCAFKRNIVL